MILNSRLIESHKLIEETQLFESNEHWNPTRSSLPFIFRFPYFTLWATLCSFLNVWISPFAIVTWKTERTVNSWNSGKTETEKGFKIGSIWPVQSALWEQGIVGIVWGACSCWALWQAKFHSSWKTQKERRLSSSTGYNNSLHPTAPQHREKPSVIIHRLCGLGIETEWKGNKRHQKRNHQTFQGNFN